MNLTEEDQLVWDPANHIRLCIHFFKSDNPNDREMVRFVSNNPLAGVDGNPMDSAFVAQYTNSKENLDDPTFWCSRRHDWDGINTEIKEIDSESLKAMKPATNAGLNIATTDAYKHLEGNMTILASTGGYEIASQL